MRALPLSRNGAETLMGSWVIVGWAVGLYLTLPPLAIGAAILRSRLYDIDRIISRTLAYGLLTVLLGGAYAGMVLELGQLLGRESSLVVPPRPWRWRPVPAGPRPHPGDR